jgi:hypothetical protein|tara:strand:+ start:173 stop:367 length:195 start_codon:yes stop_codon:yes gene_type:complete
MNRIIEKNLAEIIVIGVFLTVFLSSCGTLSPITEKEKQLEYEIDKLYLEYSYKRDSLIIEFNKN